MPMKLSLQCTSDLDHEKLTALCIKVDLYCEGDVVMYCIHLRRQ